MLSGAKADDPHGYFKEAVVNFRSESYRSCVVSTYNAVSVEWVQTLVDFMKEFARANS